jgi:hypothetical protein
LSSAKQTAAAEAGMQWGGRFHVVNFLAAFEESQHVFVHRAKGACPTDISCAALHRSG